jgi:hypothetical protein
MPRTLYESYASATAQVDPGSTLADFTFILDLSQLPSEWWAAVATDGADIRVHDAFNNELPIDLISFTHGSPGSGIVRFKYEGEISAAPEVRVYAGDANATAYDANYGKGQYAAYDDYWKAYYPFQADFNDRTSNGNNLTAYNAPAIGSGNGNFGNAIALNGSNQYLKIASGLVNSEPLTMLAWGWNDDVTANYGSDYLLGSGRTDVFDGHVIRKSETTTHQVNVRTLDGGTASDSFSTTLTPNQWNLYGGVFGVNSRTAYLNGSAATTNSTASSPGVPQEFVVGAYIKVYNNLWEGKIQDVQLHGTGRVTDWISYEYTQTDDNLTFWGTWTWNDPTPPPAGASSGSRMLIGCSY